ncbi:MAG: glycosyltransferase [Phycisphaeraceae bacterium]
MMHTAPDILLLSQYPLWPADHGVSVRGYHLLRELRELGVSVGAASMMTLPADAPPWVRQIDLPWPQATPNDLVELKRGWCGPGAWLRRRIAQHQGLAPHDLAGAVALVRQHRPAVVLGLGLHSPLMLRALNALPRADRPTRIWYAADELIYYHLSCLRQQRWHGLRGRLREMALHGLIEGLFVRGVEGAIGVSPTDTRWLRTVAGARRCVTIRNGVDLDFFRPAQEAEPSTRKQSLVFWGRLDFAPNIDAVMWFVQQVWPMLRRRWPDATWQVVGHNPGPAILALKKVPGIEIVGAVPDIRPYAHRAAVTILPMRSGGGIKNKLLEAAAMGRPIVASSRAVAGLELPGRDSVIAVADRPGQWLDAIGLLWQDAAAAASLRASARAWAVQHHTWRKAAADLVYWLRTFPRHAEISLPNAPAQLLQLSPQSRQMLNRAA